MDAEFDDEDLERLEADRDHSAGLGPGVDKGFRKVMQVIRAAKDERDLYALKGLRFEKLQGNRSHQRSFRLNDQWRLIVEIVGEAPDKTVRVISIEDYH